MHRRLVPSLLLLILLTPALPGRAAPAADRDEARARELINSQGCKACHRIDGSGGILGPDLAGLGKRLTAAQIRKQLLAPTTPPKAGFMPAYTHLRPADLNALVAYLARQQ